AIILCKTNVPEFGAGANTRNLVWGATGNPFDPRLNAGGSSGGSAVALACDMLPVCPGSDTGGSLRIPAAICGVVGFRPSPGVVPMDGPPLGWTPVSGFGSIPRIGPPNFHISYFLRQLKHKFMVDVIPILRFSDRLLPSRVARWT